MDSSDILYIVYFNNDFIAAFKNEKEAKKFCMIYFYENYSQRYLIAGDYAVNKTFEEFSFEWSISGNDKNKFIGKFNNGLGKYEFFIKKQEIDLEME